MKPPPMGSHGPGRKRTPNKNGVTPEEDALNVIAREVRLRCSNYSTSLLKVNGIKSLKELSVVLIIHDINALLSLFFCSLQLSLSHTRACTRTHARADTHTVGINLLTNCFLGG